MEIRLEEAGPAAIALAGCLFAACGGDTERTPRSGAFEDAFRLDRTIELEQDEDDPVVDVTELSVRDDGGLVVVDQPAHRVRTFDASGRREEVYGGPGRGPGELEQPSSAAVGPDGSLYVVQRGGPRLTVYEPGGASSSFNLPAHYGHWVAALDEAVAVGIGTRDERYAVVSGDGETVETFGVRRPSPADFPSGNFLVGDHEAVAGDRILVNTSFSPRVRVFDTRGDSVRTFGEPPPSWTPPEPPSGYDGGALDATEEMREWLTSFTMVTGLVTVADSLVVVQYGRYDPVPEDADRIRHEAVDVYRLDGTKLWEGLPLDEPVLTGGDRLYTLSGGPPGPWTVSAWAWTGE